MQFSLFKQTYTRRIANIFSITISVFAVIFSLLIVVILQHRFIDDKYQKITGAGEKIATIVQFITEDGEPENFRALLKFRIQQQHIPFHVLYTIYAPAPDGGPKIILANNPFIPIFRNNNKTKSKWNLFYDEKFYTNTALHLIYTTTRVGTYSVQTAMDIEENIIPAISRELPFIILIILIPMLILANIAASIIAKRMMKSIQAIITAANAISATNLEQRIETTGPNDEIHQLAVTFNNLFARLQTDFQRERQFTSDVSHELRTPVSVILGHTSLLQRWGKTDRAQLDTSLVTIQQEAKNIMELTENLLLLARSESGRIPITYSFIKIDSTFENQKANFASIHPDVTIFCHAQPDDVIYFDESRLSQILKIIINNSIQYSNSPAIIDLAFSYISSGIADRDSWRITVTDHGTGISKKDLPFVFDRLYRGDESRVKQTQSKKGGNGLGLAIAHSMLTTLNATISAISPVYDSAEFPGTTITITGKMQIQEIDDDR